MCNKCLIETISAINTGLWRLKSDSEDILSWIWVYLWKIWQKEHKFLLFLVFLFQRFPTVCIVWKKAMGWPTVNGLQDEGLPGWWTRWRQGADESLRKGEGGKKRTKTKNAKPSPKNTGRHDSVKSSMRNRPHRKHQARRREKVLHPSQDEEKKKKKKAEPHLLSISTKLKFCQEQWAPLWDRGRERKAEWETQNEEKQNPGWYLWCLCTRPCFIHLVCVESNEVQVICSYVSFPATLELCMNLWLQQMAYQTAGISGVAKTHCICFTSSKKKKKNQRHLQIQQVKEPWD